VVKATIPERPVMADNPGAEKGTPS
jgi:hypothetical protein